MRRKGAAAALGAAFFIVFSAAGYAQFAPTSYDAAFTYVSPHLPGQPCIYAYWMCPANACDLSSDPSSYAMYNYTVPENYSWNDEVMFWDFEDSSGSVPRVNNSFPTIATRLSVSVWEKHSAIYGMVTHGIYYSVDGGINWDTLWLSMHHDGEAFDDDCDPFKGCTIQTASAIISAGDLQDLVVKAVVSATADPSLLNGLNATLFIMDIRAEYVTAPSPYLR